MPSLCPTASSAAQIVSASLLYPVYPLIPTHTHMWDPTLNPGGYQVMGRSQNRPEAVLHLKELGVT